MKPPVLVVDDSLTQRLWLEMILTRQYEVHAASDGESGIKLARETHPRLIMLDITMPGLNGLETCRELREQPESQHTPIIFVTSHGEEEFLEAGYSSGGNDYILKPVNEGELLAKVESWLQAGCAQVAE